MAFLTIVTRSYRRPKQLARCVQSVARQSDPDVEQVIVYDPVGRGVEWSYENLRNVLIGGEYVFILDDDDYLLDDRFVERLKRLVREHDPEVVIVQMDLEGRILPPWSDQIAFEEIAVSCFAVKREVWLEHADDFAPAYEGDWRFINAIWNCARGHRRAWLDTIAARVGQVSHGQPEDLDLAPDSL